MFVKKTTGRNLIYKFLEPLGSWKRMNKYPHWMARMQRPGIIIILNPEAIFNIPYSFSEESEDTSQCHRPWGHPELPVSYSKEEG